MEGTAVIYHFWNDKPENIWENIKLPVIHSIAVLRGNNAFILIYVLDVSNHANNYGDFPGALNFQVIRWKANIPRIPKDPNNWFHYNYNYCASAFDIPRFAETIPEKIIIFSDVDIFWVYDPLPLRSDINKFCCHPYNMGLWYFHKESKLVKDFFNAWQKMILLGYSNSSVASDIAYRYSALGWWWAEEVAMIHLMAIHPEIWDLFDPLDPRDVFCREFVLDIPKDVRGIHLQGRMGSNRGLCIGIVSEFYELACKVLSHDLLNLLIGDLKPRISLFDITEGHKQVMEILAT